VPRAFESGCVTHEVVPESTEERERDEGLDRGGRHSHFAVAIPEVPGNLGRDEGPLSPIRRRTSRRLLGARTWSE